MTSLQKPDANFDNFHVDIENLIHFAVAICKSGRSAPYFESTEMQCSWKQR